MARRGRAGAPVGGLAQSGVVLLEASSRLPDDAMVAVDTGATMGPAISYAVAAKFAYAKKPAFALVGDGAMQMLGINALITAAKYWRRWADPRFVVAVLNNRDHDMVSWELRGLGGSPKLP